MAFSLCAYVFPKFPFLQRYQSYWIRTHPNDLILTWLSHWRPYLQIQSLSEGLDIRDSTYEFGGGGHNNRPHYLYFHKTLNYPNHYFIIVHSKGYFLHWAVNAFAEGPVFCDLDVSNAQHKNQMNEWMSCKFHSDLSKTLEKKKGLSID